MTSAPNWLADLRPVAEPALKPLARDSPLLAWHVTVAFRRWIPAPGSPKPGWAETYGKTQIVSGTAWSVAEIELARRLREAGWQAGWMDTFGSAPRVWREWLVAQSDLPKSVRDALEDIGSALGTADAGWPDLVAWRGSRLGASVFVEYKGPSDRIRAGQAAWYRAALAAGVSRDQFAVVRWPRPHTREAQQRIPPDGRARVRSRVRR
jgi:hypothetical protein